MKLAALGVVTVGVGVALGVPGLMGIGGFWGVLGVPSLAVGVFEIGIGAGDEG